MSGPETMHSPRPTLFLTIGLPGIANAITSSVMARIVSSGDSSRAAWTRLR